MCGFVGGTDPSWNYSAGMQAIEHRGPDDGHLHRDERVTVGFRRLAVIDLEPAANQPMFAADGRSWVVCNGEIYGFRELRRELEARGQVFRTRSDTEVILRAYAEWGDQFIERIDGMFAIVVWDAAEGKLKLYRDRAGIKPLYYFFDGQRFAFASELKALEHALEPAALVVDETALYDFLSYRYVPAPKSLYRNCSKLLPAHSLTYEPATARLLEPRAYWAFPVDREPLQVSADEAAEELRALLVQTVHQQMVADVPLGFFLSGGIDSSSVVAAASTAGATLDTFAIGFDADENSETPYAREVAALFGTRHHERILTKANAVSSMGNLRRWFDEPFADESALPTYLVSRVARENVTVVLTGDGGDEVFGGYRTYPRFARYEAQPAWPAWMNRATYWLRRPFNRRSAMTRISRIMELSFNKGPALWARIMSGMPEADKSTYRKLFGVPEDYDDWWHYRQHWREDLPLRTRLQNVDFHTYLPGLVLTKVDRTSMAVSLEARVPLLDRRIIEFSLALPESVRYHGNELKGILKHAYRGILPDRILDRRKKGFGIPRPYLAGVDGGRHFQEHVLRTFFPESRFQFSGQLNIYER